MSENREPQNIEYKMLNIEGKENFIIRNSLFDLPAIASRSGEAGGYSIFKIGKSAGCQVSGIWQPQRAALVSGFHLSSDLCHLLSDT
jgi:hypothetical protein